MVRGDDRVVRSAVERGAVVVVERRDGHERTGADGVQPREIGEAIPLSLMIIDAGGLFVRPIRDLVVIRPDGCDEPELIGGRGPVHPRSKAADTGAPVVDRVGHGGLETQVRAIRVHADVVRGTVAVIAQTELVIGFTEAAVVDQQLRLAIPLEARSWYHVEHAVRPIAELGGIAAPLDLDGLDVLRIELGSDVAGDVCVRDRDAVHEP